MIIKFNPTDLTTAAHYVDAIRKQCVAEGSPEALLANDVLREVSNAVFTLVRAAGQNVKLEATTEHKRMTIEFETDHEAAAWDFAGYGLFGFGEEEDEES